MAQHMTKKATILFPPALYQELQDEARRQGRSVGELVREAAMIRYGAGGVSARIEAVEKLVHLNDDVPDDPAQLEDEIIRGGGCESGAYAVGRGRPGVANSMLVIDLTLRLP